MTKFVILRGKRLKLGIIHTRSSFTVRRRITPAPQILAVELIVVQTIRGERKTIGSVNTVDEGIRLINRTQKRQIFIRKTKKRAKKIGIKLGKGLFRFVEEATRPSKKKKKRKGRSR